MDYALYQYPHQPIELQTSNFKLQSVGAYSKLVFIGAGGAQSPFRPYGGSLFVFGMRQGSCRVLPNRLAALAHGSDTHGQAASSYGFLEPSALGSHAEPLRTPVHAVSSQQHPAHHVAAQA